MQGYVYGLQALIGVDFRLPDRPDVEVEFAFLTLPTLLE
jgi:hypothetical protein